MKTGILAGGFGSRLSEETVLKPKPMVEIGGRPILWHIMMHFSHFGFDDFVIALGYRGEHIKQYMADYCKLQSDLTVDFRLGSVDRRGPNGHDWTVQLVDTGLKTQTGGRIKRLAEFFGNETFMVAWGDGLSTVDMSDLVAFHRSHGRLATVVAVHPPSRFGWLQLDGNVVAEFSEKPQLAQGWINGGYFVLEPGVLDYIDGDSTHFERQPLESLARDGQLMAYRHEGFWQCMDTLRDKVRLEKLWESGDAPWKSWNG